MITSALIACSRADSVRNPQPKMRYTTTQSSSLVLVVTLVVVVRSPVLAAATLCKAVDQHPGLCSVAVRCAALLRIV